MVQVKNATAPVAVAVKEAAAVEEIKKSAPTKKRSTRVNLLVIQQCRALLNSLTKAQEVRLGCNTQLTFTGTVNEILVCLHTKAAQRLAFIPTKRKNVTKAMMVSAYGQFLPNVSVYKVPQMEAKGTKNRFSGCITAAALVDEIIAEWNEIKDAKKAKKDAGEEVKPDDFHASVLTKHAMAHSARISGFLKSIRPKRFRGIATAVNQYATAVHTVVMYMWLQTIVDICTQRDVTNVNLRVLNHMSETHYIGTLINRLDMRLFGMLPVAKEYAQLTINKMKPQGGSSGRTKVVASRKKAAGAATTKPSVSNEVEQQHQDTVVAEEEEAAAAAAVPVPEPVAEPEPVAQEPAAAAAPKKKAVGNKKK